MARRKWKNRGLRKGIRAKVMAKTGGLCWYCGEEATTVDHIFPLNPRGYRNKKKKIKRPPDIRALSNLVPACESCNLLKSNFTLEQFRERTHKLGQGFWGEQNERGEVRTLAVHEGADTDCVVEKSNPRVLRVPIGQEFRSYSILWKLWGLIGRALGSGYGQGHDSSPETGRGLSQ